MRDLSVTQHTHRGGQSAPCWERAQGFSLRTGPLGPQPPSSSTVVAHLPRDRTGGGEAVSFRERLPPAHTQIPRARRGVGDLLSERRQVPSPRSVLTSHLEDLQLPTPAS